MNKIEQLTKASDIDERASMALSCGVLTLLAEGA